MAPFVWALVASEDLPPPFWNPKYATDAIIFEWNKIEKKQKKLFFSILIFFPIFQFFLWREGKNDVGGQCVNSYRLLICV